MAVLDPNVLNPFVLVSPAVAPALAVAITAVSVSLSLVISRYFFKSYSFSGFGYLLGKLLLQSIEGRERGSF